MDWLNKNIDIIKTFLFYAICWTTGIIFIRIGATHISLDQPDKIHIIFCIFLVAGLLLILLPFFKKVKFGVVELEREIQQTKKDMSELKTDVRQQLTVLSTSINTIGNLSNHVNLYLPGSQEIKKEAEIVEQKLNDNKENEVDSVEQLLMPHEDRMLDLAKTRIRLEYLLRGILQKRVSIKNADRDMRFLTLNQLTNEFLIQYPEYEYLNRSFDYVTRVCNASIHAQIVDEQQASEALKLGTNIIKALNKLYLK